ncbi:MAG: hypothetical protein ACYS26_07025 [Planctomycetota bacterium]|jgi:hypothetical protein
MLALQFNPLDYRAPVSVVGLLYALLHLCALISLPVIAYQLFQLARVYRRDPGEQHMARLLKDPWLLVAQQLLQRPRGPILVPVELVPTFGTRSVPYDQAHLIAQHRPGLPPGEETPMESLLNETLERFFIWLDETHYLFTTGPLRRKDLTSLRPLMRCVVFPPGVEDPQAKPLVQYLRHSSHAGSLQVLFINSLTGYPEAQTFDSGSKHG